MNLNAIKTVKKNNPSETNLNSDDLFSFKRENNQEKPVSNSINTSKINIGKKKS